MSDRRLAQNIRDYRRGTVTVYDGPASPPRVGLMSQPYKDWLLGEIRTGLDERGGKFLVESDRLVYSIVGRDVVGSLPV